jgi:cell division protein FtsB
MLSRVRRQPLHAAKRARRHRPQLQMHLRVPRPHVHVPRPHLHVPRPHLHVPRPRLHKPSNPVPKVLAFVARWRGGREVLSLERRRARTMLLGAIGFAVVVLLTSFPLGGLLSQRSALSGTAHELSTVTAENETLARQVSALSEPSTVNDLARQDYGFVPKGQRVYDILPATSASGSAAAASGQVPLDEGPVVPGSARSQALIGVVAPAGSVGPAPSSAHSKDTEDSLSSDDVAAPESHSYWGRVVQSLEFWN